MTTKKKEDPYKVWNFQNIRNKPKNYRKISAKSETIPNQAMSLRELIDRYRRGMPIPGSSNEPKFGGEDMLGINPATLDLVDRQIIMEKGIAAAEEYNYEKEKAEAEKIQKADDKRVEEELQKRALEAEREEAEKEKP